MTRVAYENGRYRRRRHDVDGYSVEAGVRGALTPNFEGYALAGYEDGDTSTATSTAASAPR